VILLRATLIVVGVVFLFGLLLAAGGGIWVDRPWEFPRHSARYLAYDYFLVRHRWLTAAAMLIYGVVVAVVFRRELFQSLKPEFGREFWLRLLLCSVIIVSLVLWTTS
jgi:TRAP-type C4-dicarboxylate transport system permease small subunit